MAGSVSAIVTGAVAQVTLHHPGKHNAMSRAMWAQLRTVFAALPLDRAVRCILVRGADGNFCAGGDISEYPQFRFDPHMLEHFHEVEVWGALQAMLDCNVPAVAGIDGSCMGAGLEIASCCDIRIASTQARFGAPIGKLGFPMAPREAALVSRAVGDSTARAMLLSAQVLDAPSMLARGFLSDVVEVPAMAERLASLCSRISGLGPAAARCNKQTLRNQFHAAAISEAGLDAPSLVANSPSGLTGPYSYAPTHEHREGIAAFLEKRAPQF